MALTKRQKLARGIKALFTELDAHYQKTAALCNTLQFFFHEPYLIIGRPLMKERALQNMMHCHRLGLRYFSPYDELRQAACTAPLTGMIITPQIYLASRVLKSTNEDLQWWVPWRVQINLPSKCLKDLHEAMVAAIPYCASKEEMSEWIDWYEEEDKANTLVNQTLGSINLLHQQDEVPEENLKQAALPLFKTAVLEYYEKIQFPKALKTLSKTSFFPHENSTVDQAYNFVKQSLQSRRRRDLEDFQQFWRDKLEELIFANLNWTEARKKEVLKERFSLEEPQPEVRVGLRWQTSLSIDRQTYGSFIRYFAERFLQNPLKNQTDGEITLLLWIMVYISRTPDKIQSIKRLLELTTENIGDMILCIDDHEYEISRGLTDLLFEYTGGVKAERQQRLFPNLTEDKLPDYFHKASKKLFPESLPALPEAFLTFPHPHKDLRVLPQLRQNWQKYPSKIYGDPISRHELKRQLIAKASPIKP